MILSIADRGAETPLYVNAEIHSPFITDSGNEKQGKEHVLVTIGQSVLINSPN